MNNKTIEQPIIDHFKDSNIKIMALGGLGEVGKNMYLIECSDEIVIVDCGMLFPDNNYGIEYIVPDFTYLKENEDKIIGLFITHGHEDHIGGIPELIKNVKINNIYASRLAFYLIKEKLSDLTNKSTNLIEYEDSSIYTFKNFEISFFRTNHSIPDSFGIAIKTRLGYIIHTGDFKIDLTPIANHTDFEKLASYAKSGVLCLLSDSTNANVPRFTQSERRAGDSIKSIFSTITGRIIISTFASNVYRVKQIVEASVETGRKVVVFGRSMEKCLDIAQRLNYITPPKGTLISIKDMEFVNPNKLTIISTGSQGEPLAALSRMADGTHKYVKITENDTIIFSSSAIPGNQDSINKTINKLYRSKATVIVNSPLTETHTSGHGGETELELMIALTKPRYFVPIHGEYAMLKRHKELAILAGVAEENCFILQNGDVLTFHHDMVFQNYRVKSGNSYIDSNNVEVSGSIIKERRLMSEDGVVTLTFLVNNKKELVSTINFSSRGFIFMKESFELISKIKKKTKDIYVDYITRNPDGSLQLAENILIYEVGQFIQSQTNRKPIIVPTILEV